MLMASRTPPFSLLGSHSETVAQRQALCYSEAFLYPNHCYASVTFPLSKIYLGTLSPVRQCWEVIEYGGGSALMGTGSRGGLVEGAHPFCDLLLCEIQHFFPPETGAFKLPGWKQRPDI